MNFLLRFERGLALGVLLSTIVVRTGAGDRMLRLRFLIIGLQTAPVTTIPSASFGEFSYSAVSSLELMSDIVLDNRNFDGSPNEGF